MQKLFQYNPAEAVDKVLFDRVLHPVTAQLAAELPNNVIHEEFDGKEEVSTSIGMDAMGRAVVAALVQMAVSCGADSTLRQLHHQVIIL